MVGSESGMDGLLLPLALFAAVAAAVVGAAALLVAGAVLAAALLPRGAPLADDLRRFAGEVPRRAWQAVGLLDGLVFEAAVVLAVVLAFVLS